MSDVIDEKDLMDIFSGMDDDLIDRQIDELLAEQGELDMDRIKQKALGRLDKGKKRGAGKKVAIVAAVAALTVSTAYAKDIQRAFQTFFGKSTVYQTVVDGDAYYLSEPLALGEQYTLRSVSMAEGRLELAIEALTEKADDWYGSLNLSVTEEGGGKSYTGGGYSYFDGVLNVLFYEMPTLAEFELLLDGEVYPISLAKADNLAVDESLVIGTSERETDEEITEALPLIANIAASRNDEGGISIVVGFDDRELKLSALGVETGEITSNYMFINDGNGTIGSSSGPQTSPLMAYDADNNAYELKEPANAVGRPVTMFVTDAAPGTPLTLRVPAIQARYEKAIDRITLAIPEEGEAVIGKEIDFTIQKAVLKTITRTSETTAEIILDMNTGADKSVRIDDMSPYSSDVIKGEMSITGDKAVIELTFEKDTEEVEVDFSWPSFVITGDWVINLNQ